MDRSQNHDNCEMVIKWRKFSNQEQMVPGLYCNYHNKWIQWLTRPQALDLIASGVRVK